MAASSEAAIEWSVPPSVPLAAPVGEAHLWSLAPSPDFASFLSPAEAGRHRGIADPEAALHYATSQGGLRYILGRYLQADPTSIPLLRHQRGKPYVSGGPEFNITHTGDYILIAFADRPVGLDVEIANRRVSARALAAKFFSPREIAHLESVPEALLSATFLRFWVAKEGTVKLSGDGIYHGLRDVEVSLDAAAYSPSATYRGRLVCLQELCPAPGVVAALASWEPLQAKCFLRL